VRRFLTYVVVVAKVGSPDHPSVHILGDVLGGEGRDLARKTRPKKWISGGDAAGRRDEDGRVVAVRGEEKKRDGWQHRDGDVRTGG
jgi:hypothetical protein